MELYSTTDFLRDFYNRIPDKDKPEMLEMYKQAMKDTFNDNKDTKEQNECSKNQ